MLQEFAALVFNVGDATKQRSSSASLKSLAQMKRSLYLFLGGLKHNKSWRLYSCLVSRFCFSIPQNVFQGFDQFERYYHAKCIQSPCGMLSTLSAPEGSEISL